MKTNALSYIRDVVLQKPATPYWARAYERVRKLKRLLTETDDYDWSRYTATYRAQYEKTAQFFTMKLDEVDFRFVDGQLFTIGDCKPLHFSNRCVWEAICNLPGLQSVAEIGVGGGNLISGVRSVLGEGVRVSGYDISSGQLRLFEQLSPDSFEKTQTGLLDITQAGIPENDQTDCVFASTVLMHIQRKDAYERALDYLIASARRYVVLIDLWTAHPYFDDLQRLTSEKGYALFVYDSGANVAVVVSKSGVLGDPYIRLRSEEQLLRYLTSDVGKETPS